MANKNASLSKDQITQILKQEILNITLKPGTIISEATLTERFGLSRTPIRDILKQLSLEGYIDIYPQKGSIVSFIDLESVEHIIFLRHTLEKEIARGLCGKLSLKGRHDLTRILLEQKACIETEQPFETFLHLDDTFHKTLFNLMGRAFIWEVIQQFNVHYLRYRQLNMLNKEKLLEIQLEHENLLNYILEANIEGIDQLIYHHLRADVDSHYFQTHFFEFIKSTS
jgi:GntR family transcriptional regulator, rspAB operon transcriptional repressor